MRNKVEVSVLCIAYNHEKYIRATLDGFVSQKTNFDFEIILHDDASTDKTAIIIKEYEDKYPDLIKVIYQTDNKHSKGINIYRDYLMPMAKGKYIALCEGDDYWSDSSKLQKQYNILETNISSSMCVHKVNTCDKDGNFLIKNYPKDEYNLTCSKELSIDYLVDMFINKEAYLFHTSSFFMKRQVMEKMVSIDNVMLDFNILKASLLFGNIFYIDEPMSVYRRFTENSITSGYKKKNYSLINKYNLRTINFDLFFDKETNYIYHSNVMNEVYKLLYKVSKTHHKDCKTIFSREKCTYDEMIKIIGLRDTIAFYININFHNISNIIRQIKA